MGGLGEVTVPQSCYQGRWLPIYIGYCLLQDIDRTCVGFATMRVYFQTNEQTLDLLLCDKIGGGPEKKT